VAILRECKGYMKAASGREELRRNKGRIRDRVVFRRRSSEADLGQCFCQAMFVLHVSLLKPSVEELKEAACLKRFVNI